MADMFELPSIDYEGKIPIDSKITITINNTEIKDFVDKISVEIQEEYDTENQFEAIDGTKYDMYLGSRRVLNIDFNEMSDSQIHALFNAIKSKFDDETNRPVQEITYVDPKDGTITKTFVCNSIPAATYFEVDGKIYWNIPTITFTEAELEKTDIEGGEGGEDTVIYQYKIDIGSMSFSGSEISKDTSISMSVSSNGYDVGQLATCSITGSVFCKYAAFINHNDKVRAYFRVVRNGESAGDWRLIHTWFLKSMELSNNQILSFTALDAISFLDNDYDIEYETDDNGNPIPQRTYAHLTAIGKMVSRLVGSGEDVSIPFYCDSVPISPQNSSNARSFVENALASGAVNCRQMLGKSEIYFESFKFGSGVYSLTEKDCEEFSFAPISETIDTVVLYCGAVTELPNKIYPEMYKDYNIYILGAPPTGSFPVAKNTIEINAQLAPISAAQTEHSNFTDLLGVNFGTEFSVSKAKVNYFFPVGTRIYLPNVSPERYYLYASSINYSLTENGIFASISGSGRSISDSYFLGGMSKDMRIRMQIGEKYKNVMVNKKGLFFVSPKE